VKIEDSVVVCMHHVPCVRVYLEVQLNPDSDFIFNYFYFKLIIFCVSRSF
jgi:hypothetical protein